MYVNTDNTDKALLLLFYFLFYFFIYLFIIIFFFCCFFFVLFLICCCCCCVCVWFFFFFFQTKGIDIFSTKIHVVVLIRSALASTHNMYPPPPLLALSLSLSLSLSHIWSCGYNFTSSSILFFSIQDSENCFGLQSPSVRCWFRW